MTEDEPLRADKLLCERGISLYSHSVMYQHVSGFGLQYKLGN